MSRNYLVTGGAGFIGSNLVRRLLERGENVTIYDNLSRSGAPKNLLWLENQFGKDSFRLIVGDVRNGDLLAESARNMDVIAHLAGQVAVTTSVTDPREDFECNALGTFNALEAARRSRRDPIFLFASTNKVYGGMEDVPILEEPTRWRYAELRDGCPETQPLDFHSPYGCSKGTGDQYVRDYARIYGLRSVVFRQSCIYGPRQFGVEDQGWLAWLMIAAVTGRQITIYGDGKQVRDILFVEDLVDAMLFAHANIEAVSGRAFNIGGGPGNTISLLELIALIGDLQGERPPLRFEPWRAADQRFYVSDPRRFTAATGWKPRVNVREGVRRLHRWLIEHRVAEAEAERISAPGAGGNEGQDIALTAEKIT